MQKEYSNVDSLLKELKQICPENHQNGKQRINASLNAFK